MMAKVMMVVRVHNEGCDGKDISRETVAHVGLAEKPPSGELFCCTWRVKVCFRLDAMVIGGRGSLVQ
jgi:hypothetical protein